MWGAGATASTCARPCKGQGRTWAPTVRGQAPPHPAVLCPCLAGTRPGLESRLPPSAVSPAERARPPAARAGPLGSGPASPDRVRGRLTPEAGACVTSWPCLWERVQPSRAWGRRPAFSVAPPATMPCPVDGLSVESGGGHQLPLHRAARKRGSHLAPQRPRPPETGSALCCDSRRAPARLPSRGQPGWPGAAPRGVRAGQGAAIRL